MANYHPIAAVDGTTVPCPSGYVYDLQDVSAADAGRTEDGTMDKRRIGQCVKLELEWRNITSAEVSQILAAFDKEYLTVTYLDAKTGGFRTSVFYVGDRTAPAYNTRLGIWSSLKFDLIERECKA